MRRLGLVAFLLSCTGGDASYVGAEINTLHPSSFQPHPQTCDDSTDFTWPLLVNSEDVIQAKRDEIITFLFGTDGYPAEMPVVTPAVTGAQVKQGYDSYRLSAFSPQTDELRQQMPMMAAVWYHLYPYPSLDTGKVLIVQNGHHDQANFVNNINMAALMQGYHVFAIHMPLHDPHEFDPPNAANHNYFQQFEGTIPGHPIRYFVDPIITTVNYAVSLGMTDIALTGISGGGWTTAIAAAIEPRIKLSFPVAGVVPLCVYPGFADYEQLHPDFISNTGLGNYLQIFLLGAWGGAGDRRQVAFYNNPEGSFNPAGRETLFFKWGHDINRALLEYPLGGSYAVSIVEHSLGHNFVPETAGQIVSELMAGL